MSMNTTSDSISQMKIKRIGGLKIWILLIRELFIKVIKFLPAELF